MDLFGLVGFNVLVSIASLLLLSLGLGMIFGLMKIINLAHGEFLMLGAYATVLTTNAGPEYLVWRCWWSRRCSSAWSGCWSSARSSVSSTAG